MRENTQNNCEGTSLIAHIKAANFEISYKAT
jgi:hypothetical protein